MVRTIPGQLASLLYRRSRRQSRVPLAALLLVLVSITGLTHATRAQSDSPTSENPESSITIEPEWTCNGIDRPFIVRIAAPGPSESLALQLLALDGAPLREPVSVRSGRQDLNELIPDIWTLRRTACIQLLSDNQPIGAPLIVQPMLTRLIPRIENALRPNNTPYRKIVGFDLPVDLLTEKERADQALRPDPMTWLARYFAESDDRRVSTGLRAWVDHDVIISTTLGDIRIALRPDEAPNTAWNFLELCRQGYYRDVIFHRIVPFDRNGNPFVVQAGDPTATGEGEPGFWLPMEPSLLPHDFGVISMARTDEPDSAGGQFFICLSREGTARLDGQYCAFGAAVDGAETILALADVPLRDVARGRAEDPPVITATTLVPAPPRTPSLGRPDQPVSEESDDENDADTGNTGGSGRISR